MSRFICLYFLLLPLIVACVSSTEIPYGQPGASVKIINGEPVFFFHRPNIASFNDESRQIAIEHFFQKHPQAAPPDCTKGVELLDWVDTENGNAIAKIKCK